MLAVLGVLNTQLGRQIRNEMMEWLSVFETIEVCQQQPGRMFEFPAMLMAYELSAKLDQPVLYLHTKGAANPMPVQRSIRALWQKEFTTRLQRYINIVNTDKPTIATPITGGAKHTWFNAWICNAQAARIMREHINLDTNRYVYENLPFGTEVDVVSPYPTAYTPNEVFQTARRIFEDAYEKEHSDNPR